MELETRIRNGPSCRAFFPSSGAKIVSTFQPKMNAPVAKRSANAANAVTNPPRSVDSVIVSGRGSGGIKPGGISNLGHSLRLGFNFSLVLKWQRAIPTLLFFVDVSTRPWMHDRNARARILKPQVISMSAWRRGGWRKNGGLKRGAFLSLYRRDDNIMILRNKGSARGHHLNMRPT